MISTLQKGAIGLAKAIYEYQKMGYTVLIPLVDAQKYDLVIEKDGVFKSVQCRTTTVKSKSRTGEIFENRYEIGLRTIKTNTKETIVRKRQEGDYDLLFVMCGNDSCYSIPANELPKSGTSLGGPKYECYKVC